MEFTLFLLCGALTKREKPSPRKPWMWMVMVGFHSWMHTPMFEERACLWMCQPPHRNRWLASRKVPLEAHDRGGGVRPPRKIGLMALAPEGMSLERATRWLKRARAQLEEMERKLKETEETEMTAYRLAAVELLGKWPVLDDPWHPEFWTHIKNHREAIHLHLRTSRGYAEYESAMIQRNEAMARWEQLMVSSERVFRVHRSLQHASRLASLPDESPEIRRTYNALRECENSAP